jgi:hypothetical protein
VTDPSGNRPDVLTGTADPDTAGPDALTAPDGPQRSDAPDGAVTPDGSGSPDADSGSPSERHPTSTTEDDPSLPRPASSSEPTADGEIHAATQTDQVNEELQEENAESALDQPSDGSGSE